MFLATYINEETLLPLPSYDLWEEKYAISTYTSATVYAGLLAASDLASLLGKSSDGVHFKSVATAIKTSILKYLYLPEKEYFCKSINQVGLDYIYDEVLDISSIYGIFTYGILDIDDPRVEKTINKIERELLNKNGIGGVPRYTNDEYFTQSKGRPNPWYICTLWLAQYYILKAKTIKDLESTKSYFDWVSKYTPKSGVMSEQLHAVHGTALSATPLTWSHAEFIRTVHMYIDKFDKLA